MEDWKIHPAIEVEVKVAAVHFHWLQALHARGTTAYFHLYLVQAIAEHSGPSLAERTLPRDCGVHVSQ